MQLRNIACIIAYDGSRFYGFASQKDDKYLTICNVIESSLKCVGIDSKITASGRTDKGVHATYQVINFKAVIYMPLIRLQKILNDRLAPYIYIKKLFEVPLDFHARFSARARFYKYIFSNDIILPFYAAYISRLKYGDVALFKEALGCFIGRHDFSLFKKNGSETKDFTRTIFKANLFNAVVHNMPCLVAHIGANGFLRSQIRLIMQACALVSLKAMSIESLKLQIDNKLDINDKSCSRMLAPAEGLYLTKVLY